MVTERSVSTRANLETPKNAMTEKSRPTEESTATWHGRYLARWGDETPLYEAVTDAVSTVTGDARSAVASKYDRAHAVALSHLFGETAEGSPPSTGEVEFVLSECIVSVHSNGHLSVSLANHEPNAST
jgi:hypothetical protein